MKRIASLLTAALLLANVPAPSAGAYVLNHTIALNGGCPQLNRMDTGTSINRRWSTSPNSAVRTAGGTWSGSGQANEIQQSILNAYAAWTGVAATSLLPTSFAALQQTPTQNACTTTDGLHTICFNDSDNFSSGVLAFARVVTSDILGESFPNTGPSAFIGEILDADVQFRPADSSNFTYATPGALNSSHFDLESVLTHELGHTLGFSHSSVMRAMMYPFAPPRGVFLGDRPTPQNLDAQLSDDDRTGLRVLYPDMSDTVHIGEISGRVLPANPLALFGIPDSSAGRPVTGIFGAHVVAVDADTGAVIAGVLGGWTCNPAEPTPITTFDGFYRIERLPVNRNYIVYAEPMDGPTDADNIGGALFDLCRGSTPNNCSVPDVNTRFNTRIRPSP